VRPAAAGGGRGRRARASGDDRRVKWKERNGERDASPAFTGACRAMRDGASVPCRDLWRGRAGPRHWSLPRWQPGRTAMHSAVEWFGRAMSVDASKSVSLKKTNNSSFKNSFKKC